MQAPPALIQADFDRLAEFSDEAWSHNNHYHPFLLRHVPVVCDQALDVGCGTGVFTRLLAARAGQVLGIDLSPNMIRIAQERSSHLANVHYQVADVLAYDLPAETFDCIASIATLHHLPLESTLLKLKAALKVGGTLLALDLFRAEGLADRLGNLWAFPTSLTLRLLKCHRLWPSRAARRVGRARPTRHVSDAPRHPAHVRVCPARSRRTQTSAVALFDHLAQRRLNLSAAPLALSTSPLNPPSTCGEGTSSAPFSPSPLGGEGAGGRGKPTAYAPYFVEVHRVTPATSHQLASISAPRPAYSLRSGAARRP
jgi:SAM-dependent methyltransferase